TIPPGAGLGGGSADASFLIQLLDKKFHLKLSTGQQLDYAGHIGSDCPFFILNKPSFAQQRGDTLEPIELNLSDYKLALIHPGIDISTARAFSEIVSFTQPGELKKIITQPLSTWKQSLKNDFEPTIFEAYPEIEKIKNNLYKL